MSDGSTEPVRSAKEIADIFASHVAAIHQNLHQRLQLGTPEFFEYVVVQLLLALGYGSAGKVVGRTADGGIDGVIEEDRLGFDKIYIQAKRWSNVVGRPEIQAFVGALQGVQAEKGVFITTSSFSRPAREYIVSIPQKVILIDGARCAELMYDANVGVQMIGVHEFKNVDDSFFSEGYEGVV